MGLLWEVEIMKKKICPKCGIEKPLTTKYFHRGKDTKEGFKSACKVCRSQIGRDYYYKTHGHQLERHKRYYRENKEKVSAYGKAYRKANKEKELARTTKWAKENPDKVKAKYKRYVGRNRERLLKMRKEYRQNPHIKAQIKYYKQSERGKQVNKRSKHKRRAKERESITTLTLEQWQSCLECFKGTCCYCGKKKENLTQDHFVPVMDGGEYTRVNILPACGHCNYSKQDKPFFEWYPKQPFYSKQRERKILRYLGYKDRQQQISLF